MFCVSQFGKCLNNKQIPSEPSSTRHLNVSWNAELASKYSRFQSQLVQESDSRFLPFECSPFCLIVSHFYHSKRRLIWTPGQICGIRRKWWTLSNQIMTSPRCFDVNHSWAVRINACFQFWSWARNITKCTGLFLLLGTWLTSKSNKEGLRDCLHTAVLWRQESSDDRSAIQGCKSSFY